MATVSPLDWIDGQPYSRRYGDVYFSSASGLGECEHVFLRGNGLAERFGRLAPGDTFTIGETGFGTGLNFLAAWQLFLAHAPPDARLAFVSTEIDPLPPTDLGRALASWPSLVRESAQLIAAWDTLPPAFHRFVFDGGRVYLTLLVGDARETLPELDAQVDAWFLDGFSPGKNPELWGEPLFGAVSRLSRPGTTCATYSVAGVVRRGLEAVGFRTQRCPGFGPKREMLCGECVAPVPSPYRAPWFRRPPPRHIRTAAVIGGGLAGTSAAASLAARGIGVTLIERAGVFAPEASGNPQGVLYIKPSAHGTPLTSLLLAGLSFSLREIARRLPEDGSAWSRSGVLALAHDEAEQARQAELAALGWPEAFLKPVDARDASAVVGIALATGGLWYSRSGWVHPPALCAALANHVCITKRLSVTIGAIQPTAGGGWWLLSPEGVVIAEADAVVAAGAQGTRAFPALSHLPLKPLRGQLTYLPGTPASAALRTVLCGEGYVAPARAGMHCVGATFGVGDSGTDLRVEDHRENLAMLAHLAPAFASAAAVQACEPAQLDGRAALRVVTPDYLPIAGPAADAQAFRTAFAHLRHDATTRFDAEAPWLHGLYVSAGHGSRGLVTALLAGELIADQMLAAPLPVASRLAQALSPTRFLVRQLVRG